MVVAAYIWGEFVYRLIVVHRRRLSWCELHSFSMIHSAFMHTACRSTRRHRLSYENFIQVTAVLITNVFWFAPNVYLLARDCSWFDIVLSWFSFVRWAMLFVVRLQCHPSGMEQLQDTFIFFHCLYNRT